MLPHKRMEYYMAQLTAHIAAGNGSKVRLQDFLFDDIIAKARESSGTKAADGAQILGAMAGGRGIVRLGLKKKLKMKAGNG